MLRKRSGDQVWLVTQPDHAAVSGYLAAHWGNASFARPGSYASIDDAPRLREEVIYGISQHDNGWWEWEADPTLAPDGLPQGLSDVLEDRQTGMDRWRRGIPRLSEEHACASLLISWHAYWLYAPKLDGSTGTMFRHPLFGQQPTNAKLPEDEALQTQSFLDEVEAIQAEIESRLTSDPKMRAWIEAEHLRPHVRLLQLLDAVSLAICSDLISTSGSDSQETCEDVLQFDAIPKSRWEDQVTLEMRFSKQREIKFDPYPFDIDPLEVRVPTRVFSSSRAADVPFQTRWNATPSSLVEYHFSST